MYSLCICDTCLHLQVDAYEQGRSGYPVEAVQYALKQLNLDTGRKKIVDLAAGTGKMTRCARLGECSQPTIYERVLAFLLHHPFYGGCMPHTRKKNMRAVS